MSVMGNNDIELAQKTQIKDYGPQALKMENITVNNLKGKTFAD